MADRFPQNAIEPEGRLLSGRAAFVAWRSGYGKHMRAEQEIEVAMAAGDPRAVAVRRASPGFIVRTVCAGSQTPP